MSTPDWMPPLPEAAAHGVIPAGLYGAYTEKQMKDYALAAVEAYKRSLKPEMWGMLNNRGGWRKVAINGSSDEEMLTLGWIPLYRLDGGDDDAA